MAMIGRRRVQDGVTVVRWSLVQGPDEETREVEAKGSC
jgi:hypothetical protein